MADETMIDALLDEAEERMTKSVESCRNELGTVRTGRASPHLLDRIMVDYYGAMTPITQLSSISVPEARMAIVKPYEASQLGAIETAIRNSDLGVNPGNDGTIIRISLPQLTEERRRDLAKQARGKGEDAKVSLRNIRRSGMDELSRIQKDGEAGEDEVTRAEAELDKTTAKYVAQVDEIVKNKEAELMEV